MRLYQQCFVDFKSLVWKLFSIAFSLLRHWRRQQRLQWLQLVFTRHY